MSKKDKVLRDILKLKELMDISDILEENQIDDEVILKYRTYNTANRGCNPNDPFVISQTERYVGLEYNFFDTLMEYACRDCSFPLFEQQLTILDDGRKIDSLTFRTIDREQPDAEPGIEVYYFDITKGYDALTEDFKNYKRYVQPEK